MTNAVQTEKPVAEMTDREIAEETLTRLRAYEVTVRGVIEAAKKNPALSMMLRAQGINF